MTTKSATRGQKTPTARDRMVAAILAAASELFAERGPAATSIRDIATRSKVNQGLVFRYIGNKEQLVGAVLDHLGANLAEVLQSEAPADVVDRAVDQHMRVMARTLLDGYPVGQLQKSFPTVNQLLDKVRPRHDNDASARVAVANALALQFGWRLFGPMLRSATGIDHLTDAEQRDIVRVELARIVEPQPPKARRTRAAR